MIRFGPGKASADETGPRREARAERCSFCGKRRHQVAGMAAAAQAKICGECLDLCREIRDEIKS